MVVVLLNAYRAADSFFGDYAPKDRIASIWLHEPRRLTDRHITFLDGAKPQFAVNVSSLQRAKKSPGCLNGALIA